MPTVSSASGWHLEAGFDVSAEPADARRPQGCLDASPVQLTSETRHPLPARPGQPGGDAYEYNREGTANLFLFVQPVPGWRPGQVTAQRPHQELAQQLKLLGAGYGPPAEVIRLVVATLNPHPPAARYATLAPAAARRLTRQVAFHYTPPPGSWLNMAEGDCAVLAGQCWDRRIPKLESLRQESSAWQTQRNPHQAQSNWQFGTDSARVNLKRLYPSVKEPAETLVQGET